MPKIPRVNAGSLPSAVPGGPLPSIKSGGAEFAGAVGHLADVGFQIAAREEHAEAENMRRLLESKQAIVNEVSAGRMVGDYEEMLSSEVEALQKENWTSPDKVPLQLLERGRANLDALIDQAPNTQQGLEVARSGNARLMAEVRRQHDWAQLRQTQQTKGELEAQKNQVAVKAGRFTSAGQLEGFLSETQAALFPKFEKVYGASAAAEWHEASTRAVESFARVQGDKNPVGTLEALTNPTGAIEKYLTPEKRDVLINRTEMALEKRGRQRQFEILNSAAGKNLQAVEALNTGTLDAPTIIALQHENDNAQKAAAIDRSFTPEQRKAQVAELQKQAEVLAAVDEIYMRGVKFDPTRQQLNDVAAYKEVDKALKKFKGGQEQLPLLVEQMQRLTLMRKTGEISSAGYAAAFGHVGLAYKKALSDEADNDGFWIFQNSREAANAEMNRLLGTVAQNVPQEKKDAAWTAYMSRYVEASKKGNVGNEAAKRMARQSISLETGKDVRVKGD